MLQYPEGELKEDSPQFTRRARPYCLRLLLLGLEFTGPRVGAFMSLQPCHGEHLCQQRDKVFGLAVLHTLMERQELKITLERKVYQYLLYQLLMYRIQTGLIKLLKQNKLLNTKDVAYQNKVTNKTIMSCVQ